MVKNLFVAALVTSGLMISSVASADIVDVHVYNFDNTGAVNDEVGSKNFTLSGSSTVSSTNPSPASSTYVSVGATGGYINVNLEAATAFPTDDFGIEFWARTSDVNQSSNDIFHSNGPNSNGSLKIGLDGNGEWQASYHNLSWIGAANGAGQTAAANVWTNLAVIRYNGTSTLYIDGVAQAGTTAALPDFGTNVHFGVTSGGFGGFAGDLDQLRFFTFDSNVDSEAAVVASLSPNAVPEPSSLALLGLAGLGLVVRRRR